jgi:hypothetical protein
VLGAAVREDRLDAAAASRGDADRDSEAGRRLLLKVEDHFERRSIPFRYAWPAELDLMALLAGMELRERWSSWKRQPFTAESREQVSVWQKPTSPLVPH